MTSSQKRLVLVVLALVLGATAIMRAWFSSHGISVGLWGVEICDHGCHGVRWDDAGAQLDVYAFGYVGVAVALVTAAITLLASLGERSNLMKLVRTMSTVTLVAMVAFVVRILVEGGISLSWAAIVGPLAAVMIRVLATDQRS